MSLKNAKWYNTLQDSLAVSYKTNHTLIIWSRNHSSVFTQRKRKLMIPQPPKKQKQKQNLYMDVYSSFIHNCQNLEAIKMSYNI